MDAGEALKQYFGFDRFRDGQEDIVSTITSGRDALVVMPTGGGKSLCYQLPALLLPGATLVISPLIALMKDQVDALRAKGIAADTINSSLSPAQQDERIAALSNGSLKLLYVAPERFGQRRFVEALSRANVSLVAVDEAHCVSQWGHDFRPDYLKIGRYVSQLRGATLAAFTATATPDVRADIVTHLALREPEIFVTGFARPNLSFRVVQAGRKMEKFRHIRKLAAEKKTGIIYCSTRKHVDEVFEEVQSWGVKVVAYHAGLSEEARNAAQDRFVGGKADLAVATNAFGMGIDRSDIRFVAHYEIPGSIEAYYQEAGRAGRDGLPGECHLLYSYADKRTQEFFIEGSNPGVDMIRLLWDFLRREADAQGEVQLSIGTMAEKLGIKNDMMLGSALSTLMKQRYVERFDISGLRAKGTRILRADLTGAQLDIDTRALLEKERRDFARLQAVIDYGTSGGCRQEWMLHYFGDENAAPCGCCDWCRRDDRQGVTHLDDEQFTVLRKALSGVARMSKRVGNDDWEGLFGLGKIADMLCGRQKGPMREHGLNKLSTFGILEAQGMDFTKALLDECLVMGLLRKSRDERPVVTLTKLGTRAMKGDFVPELLWPGPDGKPPMPAIMRGNDADLPLDGGADGKAKKRKRKAGELFEANAGKSPFENKKRKATQGAEGLDSDDAELFESLKRKRFELAQERGVPAYQIFPDSTLRTIAQTRPTTRDEALQLPGIGPHKASREFPPFAEIVKSWV
ncbi:MAG: ATP-dependent DNA helicase RecQ [Opitutales bacterium]|nr:ATP-dependent DNA helicase RecQ [Opitutales bacterium]